MRISYILTLEPEGEKNGSFAFPGGTFPGICSYITIITSKCNKWYCCGIKKFGIGHIRKYVVSTRLSPERKLRFSALCREAGQPPAEVLRQLIDRGTVRARITREQLDFMAQLKGVARNLNQLTRLANAKGLAAVRARHAAIVTAIEKLLKQICDGR